MQNAKPHYRLLLNLNIEKCSLHLLRALLSTLVSDCNSPNITHVDQRSEERGAATTAYCIASAVIKILKILKWLHATQLNALDTINYIYFQYLMHKILLYIISVPLYQACTIYKRAIPCSRFQCMWHQQSTFMDCGRATIFSGFSMHWRIAAIFTIGLENEKAFLLLVPNAVLLNFNLSIVSATVTGVYSIQCRNVKNRLYHITLCHV